MSLDDKRSQRKPKLEKIRETADSMNVIVGKDRYQSMCLWKITTGHYGFLGNPLETFHVLSESAGEAIALVRKWLDLYEETKTEEVLTVDYVDASVIVDPGKINWLFGIQSNSA